MDGRRTYVNVVTFRPFPFTMVIVLALANALAKLLSQVIYHSCKYLPYPARDRKMVCGNISSHANDGIP